MGWLDVLGAVIAGVAAIAAICLTVHVVNKALIRKELRKKGLEYAIVENIKRGNVNTVNVGLYDDSDEKIEEIEYSADEIDDDIKEGMVIYA